ncbi:MAG: hypothetical protein AcusKO_13170 [Acuticoccus sp.]
MASEKAGDGVVIRQAGVPAGGALHAALDARADVMAMTEDVHTAALTPADPGGLSHAERAALAARIARIHADEALAAHYLALPAAAAAPTDLLATVADPAAMPADARLAALCAFTDRVARDPRNATAADIEALKTAGIADDDIVRLAELNAFLAYQIRLIAGLKLVGGTA